MSKYDDLFAETEPGDSVLAEKRALDPLQPPAEIRGREGQECQLTMILNGGGVSEESNDVRNRLALGPCP